MQRVYNDPRVVSWAIVDMRFGVVERMSELKLAKCLIVLLRIQGG